MSMSAIRPIFLFAPAALLATLAACASNTPTAHTSDTPAASADGMKGNAASGKALFMSSCTTCHGVTAEANSMAMVGPSLFGVVGRTAGTVKSLLGPSENLKKHGVTWSTETLDEFLANPLAILPKDTAMAGVLPDPKQRADVIAFLATLKK
jgi:cytochrome c